MKALPNRTNVPEVVNHIFRDARKKRQVKKTSTREADKEPCTDGTDDFHRLSTSAVQQYL